MSFLFWFWVLSRTHCPRRCNWQRVVRFDFRHGSQGSNTTGSRKTAPWPFSYRHYPHRVRHLPQVHSTISLLSISMFMHNLQDPFPQCTLSRQRLSCSSSRQCHAVRTSSIQAAPSTTTASPAKRSIFCYQTSQRQCPASKGGIGSGWSLYLWI